MKGWRWLVDYQYDRAFMVRVLLKASILFIIINMGFVIFQPVPLINRLSLYNWLVPGRERLPYGASDEAFNLSIDSFEGMFASHVIERRKQSNELRVLLLGDSSVWGLLLDNEHTLSGYLNRMGLQVGERVVRVYNLGYPTMAVTKDLMFLDYALRYEPDMVIWPVTLESLPISQQLSAPLLQNNVDRVRDLISRHNLPLDEDDERFIHSDDFLSGTLVGQRRALADWWRLQLYGIAYALTGVDQVYTEFVPRANDFGTARAWYGFDLESPFREEDLAFDMLDAAYQLADDLPILLVNEPIFIGDGDNSDMHYNAWYPQWAYDKYRQLLARHAGQMNWHYVDAWDVIDPDEFTDSPVHLTREGTRQLSEIIAQAIMRVIE